jgi:glucose-6-phosphate 1-epimerase
MVPLPNGARFENGADGLEQLVLAAPGGEARIYMHGAHVASFRPAGGRPVLMMSSKAQFEAGTPGKPIRGGVPICFPWFGSRASDPKAPPHGVARLLTWDVESVTQEDQGRLRAALTLTSNDYTRGASLQDFALRYVVTVGDSLEMALTACNTSAKELPCEMALHSYFAVSDARQVSIRGLERATYLDKTDAWARKTAGNDPVVVAGETDRVFVGTQATVTLADPGWKRRVVVRKSGSNTTVIWNPWIDNARAIADLGDDDWQGTVCIETANAADDALTLAPGAAHTMIATISVERE